jgi:hypothetical protein
MRRRSGRTKLHRLLLLHVRVRLIAALLGGAICLLVRAPAWGQEGFEIRVEQYENLRPGTFSFEQHASFVGRGDRDFDNSVAPTHHQLRFASELTVPITRDFSLGTMVLAAIRPGQFAPEYAGARLIPHFYAPGSWRLPVKLGLTAEFSWSKGTYTERTPSVELKPVIEKEFGPFQLDLNLSAEGALYKGSHWSFEPSLRFAYRSRHGVSPGVEYYSELGAFSGLLPVSQQMHRLYPTVDLSLSPTVQWHFGVGVGLTPAGNELVYKTRIEFTFGKKVR